MFSGATSLGLRTCGAGRRQRRRHVRRDLVQGKFRGVIAPTTPTGSRTTRVEPIVATAASTICGRPCGRPPHQLAGGGVACHCLPAVPLAADGELPALDHDALLMFGLGRKSCTRCQGLGTSPMGTSMSTGLSCSAAVVMAAVTLGARDAFAGDTERLGECNVVGVDEVGAQQAFPEARALGAPDVAERRVVEDDGDQPYPVLLRGRQLLEVPAEASVAVGRDDDPVGVADLRAERGREPIAEGALVAGCDVGARAVDG